MPNSIACVIMFLLTLFSANSAMAVTVVPKADLDLVITLVDKDPEAPDGRFYFWYYIGNVQYELTHQTRSSQDSLVVKITYAAAGKQTSRIFIDEDSDGWLDHVQSDMTLEEDLESLDMDLNPTCGIARSQEYWQERYHQAIQGIIATFALDLAPVDPAPREDVARVIRIMETDTTPFRSIGWQGPEVTFTVGDVHYRFQHQNYHNGMVHANDLVIRYVVGADKGGTFLSFSDRGVDGVVDYGFDGEINFDVETVSDRRVADVGSYQRPYYQRIYNEAIQAFLSKFGRKK